MKTNKNKKKQVSTSKVQPQGGKAPGVRCNVWLGVCGFFQGFFSWRGFVGGIGGAIAVIVLKKIFG